MTQGSSLPPLKKNDGKYGLLAFLLLLLAGGLWFFLRNGEAREPEAVEAAPEEPERAQFVPEIEIPEDAAVTESPTPKPAKKPNQSGTSNPADWDCRGTLDVAQVRSVISGAPSKQVQTCYERRLKDDNLLQGSMNVTLTLGASGSVRAVSINGTLNDNQVYSCVKRVAKTWKFPKPQGGCVRVAVPFQMTPKL